MPGDGNWEVKNPYKQPKREFILRDPTQEQRTGQLRNPALLEEELVELDQKKVAEDPKEEFCRKLEESYFEMCADRKESKMFNILR